MKKSSHSDNGSNTGRIILYIVCDMLSIDMALALGLGLWYAGTLPGAGGIIQSVPATAWQWLAYMCLIGPLVTVAVLAAFRLYNNLWRYAGVDEMMRIFIACAVIMVGLFVVDGLLLRQVHTVPRRSLAMTWFLFAGFSMLTRLGDRAARRFVVTVGHLLSRKTHCSRVLIVGAGYTGYNLAREMLHSPTRERLPVLFVDDDPAKINVHIMGIRICGGTNNIPALAAAYAIDEIVVAIPGATNAQLRTILEQCTKTNCRLKLVPPVSDVSDGFVQPGIRDVGITDLLYRDEIRLDNASINAYLTGATVLVTGGGGSIGSELCRQIVKHNPACLVIVDIYENNAFNLMNELREKYAARIDFKVGSIRDSARMDALFAAYKPSVVFHAAAHKHVILMEESPAEAVKNNIFGTMNIIRCALAHETERFVLISTDKAVNPANVYGATKRAAELLMQRMAQDGGKTKLMAVRFGNVMGSDGSVIPKFKRQIAAGGPVTVYHRDVTRYFMTTPEACQLVLQASGMAQSGHIFVLDMGEPVNIDDMARKLIRLSGLKPDVDIAVTYTGLLPGEKMYEELMLPAEKACAQLTCHAKIAVVPPLPLDFAAFDRQIEILFGLSDDKPDQIPAVLQAMPLMYQPADTP